MAERNQLAVFGQLVTGLLAKFAQRNLFHWFRRTAGVSAPGYSVVDLTRRHFPNRPPDGDAFLANENNSAVACHGRDNDGCFPMHNCPNAGLASRWRSDVIGHDFEMLVGKTPLARDGLPVALFHAGRL